MAPTTIEPRRVRLAYFVSHPIQYQAPLLRLIAGQPEIDLTVYFTSDFSVRGYLDPGFRVTVEWDTPLLDGYSYEFLPKRLFRKAHYTRQVSAGIVSRLRTGRFDLVWLHGYSTPDALQVLLASRFLGMPLLLRSDSNLYDRARSSLKLAIKRAFFRLLKQTVSGVLACGVANRQYWEHYFGRDFPIFDMPYAVDNAFFQGRARQASLKREELREQLHLEPGRPIVLFASKLQSRKRCIDLVEAMQRLRERHTSGVQPYLLIIGDGEERAALEGRVSGDNSVRMLGFRNQSELPRFFDLCDVFVLPSVHEPWGLVVNEAMNAGRAIVVSDRVGCGPDLVHDGVNGCVFPAGDADSLAQALDRILWFPETLARMGRESLRRIAAYSLDRDLEALRGAIDRLLPATAPAMGRPR